LDAAPDIDASLSYVIICWPVIDPISRYEQALAGKINPVNGTPESIAQEHILYFGDEATMREANPHLMLERGEPAQLPPTLIVQGAADEQLAPLMVEKFLHAYSDAGGVIELAMYPGEPHGFMRSNPGSANSRRALDAIKSFIARQLAAA
jgi:acetyl esterase/lipase